MQVLDVLERIKDNSLQTYEHSVRVGNLTFLLALSLNMPAEESDRMKMAGYLHDVGKNAIWDIVESDINFNEVSAEERNLFYKKLEKHVYFDSFLKDCEDVEPEYIDAIHYHHNKYNGEGYSKDSVEAQDKSLNLEGVKIPKVAQLICIVDIYDALRNPRSYKEPYSLEKTMDIMKEELSAGHFNPQYAKTFLDKVIPAWEKMTEKEKLTLNPKKDEAVAKIKQASEHEHKNRRPQELHNKESIDTPSR